MHVYQELDSFTLLIFLKVTIVLYKTLIGIRGVRLDNRKGFFVHQVLTSNILSAFLSFNKLYYSIIHN